MAKKVYCSIILCLLVTGAIAQNVAVINGKPISTKEFMWFYKKHHSGNANATYKDMEAYLNLYIDFKLKVLEAKELGLDKDTAYIAEVNKYDLALKTQKRISKSKTEYSFLVNEYKEAVLMFNLSETKIWEKAQNDEIGLRSFYDKNKNIYLDHPFDEIRGDVIADYQQSLENQWITSLRKKYTVTINDSEIKKIAK